MKHYHLFPGDAIDVDKEGIALCRGLHKYKGSFGRDEWSSSSTLYISKARKPHECHKCKRQIKVERRWIERKTKVTSRYGSWYVGGWKTVKSEYYVGVDNFMACEPGYWGADFKICLECATKLFSGHKVYKRDDYCMDSTPNEGEEPDVTDEPLDFVSLMKVVEQ